MVAGRRGQPRGRQALPSWSPRNHADGLIHATRSAIKDNGDKVPGDDRLRRRRHHELESAIKGDDKGQIEAKAKALEEAAYFRLAAGRGRQQAGGDAGRSGAAGGNDDVGRCRVHRGQATTTTRPDRGSDRNATAGQWSARRREGKLEYE